MHHATNAVDDYEVDPAMARDINERLERLDGRRRAEITELLHTVILCFDEKGDSEATLLVRHKGIIRVIGINSAPESSAMMLYAANAVLNDHSQPPAREMMN